MKNPKLKDLLGDLALTVMVAFMLGFFIWYARQADRAVTHYEQWVNDQVVMQLPEKHWQR